MERNGFPHVVIAGAARTPIGMKCGTLSGFSAEDLAVLAAEQAIRRVLGMSIEDFDRALRAWSRTSEGRTRSANPVNYEAEAIRAYLRGEV